MTPALSATAARHLHLAAQGLLTRPRRRATRRAVLAAIERMRLLQIDSIHVVARSPYLVLHSRLGAYEPRWLDELLARGELFETWSHEACFVPSVHFPWHRVHLTRMLAHWSGRSAERVRASQAEALADLIALVRTRGPLQSADFARPEGEKGGGWWGWKTEKRLLEAAFALGELMVAQRVNFQRVYDLTERVRSRLRPAPGLEEPTPEEVRRQFILDTVRALGITRARWIADYFRLRRQVTPGELAPLLASGEILEVVVAGWPSLGYVHRDHAELLERAQDERLTATHTTLLSPFDPVVWDRARVLELFGFDYRIECYTPAPKRRFGYFVLPILHRGRLVGRLDAKAHRGAASFEVKALFLEPGVRAGKFLVADLARALRESAAWHGCPRVVVTRGEPEALVAELRRALG
ncbi:MAG: crosslink repair DNA glycosylase YcaQ family protein [Thermoanaerobaculia bacterium]|nr:crosslink repair DNA glycosylase YcaQ family protein [Thermoanaerobaculia bacterium]